MIVVTAVESLFTRRLSLYIFYYYIWLSNSIKVNDINLASYSLNLISKIVGFPWDKKYYIIGLQKNWCKIVQQYYDTYDSTFVLAIWVYVIIATLFDFVKSLHTLRFIIYREN